MENLNETQFFDSVEKEEQNEARNILLKVSEALKEKGYNPVNQIVGYILSGDPTYITSHKSARSLIMKVERDEILEELMSVYIDARLFREEWIMRILGLDYGEKTIGVAVSDGFGWTAQALEVIKRSHSTEYKKSISRIAQWIKEYEVDTIVLGYPKNMDNTEGERCQKTKIFQKQLQQAFPNVTIVLWDERMSTIAAERSLLEADMSRKKRKSIIDKMAAVHILQGYLDKKQNEKC